MPSTGKRLAFAIGMSIALVACSTGSENPAADAGWQAMYEPDAGVEPFTPPPDTKAILEIQSLDIWAQPLARDGARVSVTHEGSPVAVSGFPVSTVALTDSGRYEVTVDAPNFNPSTVVLDFDGSDSAEGLGVRDTEDELAGRAINHATRSVDGRTLPLHTLYVGLRHKWFSAEGPPARLGNSVTLFTDFDAAWSSVYDDVRAARHDIDMSYWWWNSDFEAKRNLETGVTLSSDVRRENTLMAALRENPATKRVLLTEFFSQDGLFSHYEPDVGGSNVDDALLARGDDPHDNFEFMGQANVTHGQFRFEVPPFSFTDRLRDAKADKAMSFDREQMIQSTVPGKDVDLEDWPVGIDLAMSSFHQKFAVIDGQTAYVGGMNVADEEWDGPDHLVFDPRRMMFDRSEEDRQRVADKIELPDFQPRKDYMVRMEGPAVQDVQDVFHQRWYQAILDGVEYSWNATNFEVQHEQPRFDDGLEVQVTVTLPRPYWQHSILETWFNAVRNAERFIYIEDQYFRIPLLLDAIIKRMDEKPDLKLVVITNPVSEWRNPGCYWTSETTRLMQERFPDRFMLLQLKSFDTHNDDGLDIDETGGVFAEIYVHSKMMIVDDQFMSIGSCNKNNRGSIYEGEMNLAILDAAWVHDKRMAIFEHLLSAGTSVSDDVDEWWNDFRNAADWNDAAEKAWHDEGGDLNLNGAAAPDEYVPRGYLYSLQFDEPSECFIEPLSPDLA